MPVFMSAAAQRKTEIIPPAELPAFQTELLGWFAGAKRNLDWRRTRDPYRIWISEIMLQQTRVAVVLPYYRRFLTRFPTIDALARARLDAVLRSWAGLGYYSRARNLHRAAKQIVTHHGGEFPRCIEEALALPGVGYYTAAAVLSIAYGEPHAVVDGNVARVLTRLGAIRGDLRRPKKWRDLAGAANALLPAQAASGASAPITGAGDWNQAVMELGATLCTPRAPQCASCPVARWCRAQALGIAWRLPTPRRKPRPIGLALSAAVLLDPRGRTLLLRQSQHSNLFSALWHFPAIRSARTAPEKLARYLQSTFGITAQLEPLAPARHTITFRRILLAPFLVRLAKLPVLAPPSRELPAPGPHPRALRARALQVPQSDAVRTPRLADIERLPISSATRKIAAAARALAR